MITFLLFKREFYALLFFYSTPQTRRAVMLQYVKYLVIDFGERDKSHGASSPCFHLHHHLLIQGSGRRFARDMANIGSATTSAQYEAPLLSILSHQQP